MKKTNEVQLPSKSDFTEGDISAVKENFVFGEGDIYSNLFLKIKNSKYRLRNKCFDHKRGTKVTNDEELPLPSNLYFPRTPQKL